MVNDANLATRAAVDGLGIAFTPEAVAEPFCARVNWSVCCRTRSPSFEGIVIYYPGHLQLPASLRAFIDTLRAGGGMALTGSGAKNPFVKD
jgi:DNA-binding transcriptional LysR family regulator